MHFMLKCFQLWNRVILIELLSLNYYILGTLYSTSAGGTGPVFMSSVSCSGSETRLLDCSYTIFLSANHSNDVSVSCSPGKLGKIFSIHINHWKCFLVPVSCTDGDIQLVGGETEREGRVEVCLDQRWGTVNGDGWSSVDAQVVCRQLGYLTAGKHCLGVPFIHCNLEICCSSLSHTFSLKVAVQPFTNQTVTIKT